MPKSDLKKCNKCNRKFEKEFFTRCVKSRNMKMTKRCYYCRKKLRSKLPPAVAACREEWSKYKRENKCIDCGLQNENVIQADHVRGQKIEKCSEYIFWAHNGGVESQRKEMYEKCVPRCRFCHIKKTKKLWAVQRDQPRSKKSLRELNTKLKKQEFVDSEKLRRGECALCKRKVTKENTCCFIFDHGENYMLKNFTISNYVNQNRNTLAKAKIPILQEILLCRLLCSNCDWESTRNHLWTGYNDPHKKKLEETFLLK